MKKEIRITIDGYCNTGKTLLMHAFADLLKQNGVEDAQISFFTDTMDGAVDYPRVFEEAVSHGIWKDVEFAFVERSVPRPFMLPNSAALEPAWRAKPEKYSPVFFGKAHIDMEMGRFQPVRLSWPGSLEKLPYDNDTGEHAPSVLELMSGEASVDPTAAATPQQLTEVPSALRLRAGTRQVFDTALGEGTNALNASAALPPHETRDAMIAKAEARLTGESHQDEGVKNFVDVARVASQPEEDALRFTGRATMKHVRAWIAAQNPKHGVRLNTILVMVEQYNDFLGNLDAGGHTLEPAMLSTVRERMWKTALNTDQAFVPDRSLLSRYVDVNIANRREAKEHLIAHNALSQTGRDALQAMTSEQVRASSPLMVGRAFGENLGDHNGELETVFKYQMQIHPQTGETREQMLVRAQSFIRGTHIGGGQLALDYSNLPTDLVFDQQCGVRWKTPAEMAQTQREVDAVFEKAQDNTVAVKRPRGMNPHICHYDDPAFIKVEDRPDHPLDPLLKETEVAQRDTHMGINLLKVRE